MMLNVTDLSVALSGSAVLDAVSFAAAQGEIVGLIGPNGAGKTTLMRAIAGLLPHDGTIRLAGTALADLSPFERARRLAFLPQGRSVAWGIPVDELVMLGRLPYRAAFAAPSGEDVARAADAMALLDIAPLARRRADRLSGGEQARVLAARAIAQDTPLLLADEPVAGLDPAHQVGMMRAFRALATRGRTIIVSLHDLTLGARWCDRLLLLKQGRLAADGKPEEVLTAGQLQAAFALPMTVGTFGGGLAVVPRMEAGA